MGRGRGHAACGLVGSVDLSYPGVGAASPEVGEEDASQAGLVSYQEGEASLQNKQWLNIYSGRFTRQQVKKKIIITSKVAQSTPYVKKFYLERFHLMAFLVAAAWHLETMIENLNKSVYKST